MSPDHKNNMDPESEAHREQRLQYLWRQLDANRKGTLDLPALRAGLAQMNHPLKDADGLIRDMLSACDINHDGHMTYDEFRRFCRQTEHELWKLFQAIDRDRNGNLDKSELSQALAKSGVAVSNARIDRFFGYMDKNHDGRISFAEWRDFLLFIPTSSPGLKQVFNYYTTTVKLTAEGDVHLSDEALSGLGYFAAGGLAGVVARTATAPLDRLKVYLIAQTGDAASTMRAVQKGQPVEAARRGTATLLNACREVWRAGGMKSLYAGNGLNVIKVMPESAVKFGSYEASKRAIAKLEGHGDPKHISSISLFTAGGVAGMISSVVTYPLDTLKFRTQCETVPGAPKGNRLIIETFRKMLPGGARAFYRGLPLGLAGMFPYSAIDLWTFEKLKRTVVERNMRLRGTRHEEDALPSNFALALIGGFSGAIGASAVYPVNLLRTRLQSMGTTEHPPIYTGAVDVTLRTVRGEGWRGLFKGLTPNLLKVVPAVSITYVVYENAKHWMHLS